MAAASGAESASLSASEKYTEVEKLLKSEPWAFNFFQAVRLMQRILPNRKPVGGSAQPAQEVVRFAAHTSTSFPASQIQELRWSGNAQPVMVVNFMGLHGPSGVMPLYYSELIRDRLRNKDTTLLAFFNLFNHRMVSLFYCAWEKYRFTVAYERQCDREDEARDRVSQDLLSLIGLGTRGLQNRQQVADDSLLYFSGLLALHTRSETALESLISDYFDVPAEVEQFTGKWHRLAVEDQCRFEHGSSVAEQLGTGVVVGDEILDPQSGARIRLGPLPFSRYIDFLPEGSAWAPLQALTRLFSGDEIDYEIQLVLMRDEVPVCELGVPSDAVRPQLGWSSWAKTKPMHRDPADAVLGI